MARRAARRLDAVYERPDIRPGSFDRDPHDVRDFDDRLRGWEGRLLTIDEEALLGEAEALGARMIEEMAPRRYVQLGTNVDYL